MDPTRRRRSRPHFLACAVPNWRVLAYGEGWLGCTESGTPQDLRMQGSGYG